MIGDIFLSTASDLPVWLLRLVFSVTLVCLAAAAAVVFLRRYSAAMRHRIWALSVAASLAMPAIIVWSPEIRLGWLSIVPRHPAVAVETVTAAEPASPAIEFDPRVFEPQAPESIPAPRPTNRPAKAAIAKAVAPSHPARTTSQPEPADEAT